MANYQFATLTDLQNAVLQRLYDNGVQGQPSGQYWTPAEITYYSVEALRAWNAYTGFWRNQFAFNLVANQNWYDITQQTNTLRPYTVTDQYLVNQIEYHLLEPQTSLNPSPTSPATWTGSNQFSLNDILQALTRRQNDCLGVTGCTVAQSLVNATAATRRTILGDKTLDIRRVAWIPATGFGYQNTILRQSDNWELQAFKPNWTALSQGTPRQWLQSNQPPPAFDVDRLPAAEGNWDVLTINAGNVSNATSAQLMSVPDDWTFVIKWGALADLLSKEANARDAFRAGYCQARYAQDCQILMNAPATLGLQIDGFPAFVDSVRNGDDFNPNWQSQTATLPTKAYQSGLNYLGFPNLDQAYSVLWTGIQNAPVPVNGSDWIQIDRGDYDALIGEIQHVALFKIGGAEFSQSIPLHQAFLDRAKLYNDKLGAMGQFNPSMQEISQREERRNPRLISASA